MLAVERGFRSEGVLAALLEEDEPELPPPPSDEAAFEVRGRRARPPEPREREDALDEIMKLSPLLSRLLICFLGETFSSSIAPLSSKCTFLSSRFICQTRNLNELL